MAGIVVTPESTAIKIEEVRKKFGKAPVLALIDHVDYQYGNLHDVAAIAKVAHQYDVPVLCNGAYTVGILPVDGKALGVDFVVGSGHKSMAAPAPSGVLAATAERAKDVFRTTSIEGDVTKRRFGIKEPEMMGCTLMGATLVGMMASFPHVRERVKHFDRELENNRVVTEALLTIEGTKILSEPAEAHADPCRYHRIVRQGSRIPQEEGILFLLRAEREGDLRHHPGRDPGLEVQYLRHDRKTGPVPCRCLHRGGTRERASGLTVNFFGLPRDEGGFLPGISLGSLPSSSRHWFYLKC